jgi:D-alanine-D-alanine ligase
VSIVGAFFGSRSVEHEVSVITAHQAMAALSPQHRAVPVYIAKDGRWYTGKALTELRRFADVDALLADCVAVSPIIDPAAASLILAPVLPARRGVFGRGVSDGLVIDVAMPLLHGRFGEEGTIQGLFEMASIPYTGSGVTASAVAMDKRLAKTVLRGAGLPVLDDVAIERERWRDDPDAALRAAEALAPYPLYVKPVTLGSSIGVSRAADAGALRDAVEVALTYDERCLIEAAQEGIVEINCAVLGDGADARTSLLEQPTKTGLLTYDDKYRSKSGKSAGMKSTQRLIPAPLDDALAARIRAAALASFAAVGASGVARVDLMVDIEAQTFVVNEVNPIPGSLSFYLFEPAGLSFTALLDELLAIAERRHARRQQSTEVFDRWMLAGGGAKTDG